MLGSSSNVLAVDAGNFSVKSISGKWKNVSNFAGQVGNHVVRMQNERKEDPVENDIHHSIMPIYSKKAEVYTVISLSDVIVREVGISDALTDYEVEGAIEVELSESLPFSLDQVYFDFKPISRELPVADSLGEKRYLVAASRRDIIDPLTRDICSFGKQAPTVHVDIGAYAYGRLISHLYREVLQDELVLLVDVAHERSRFYFYDDINLVFNREQQIGGKYATESIAEIYDLSFTDAQLLKHRDDQDKEFHQLVVKPFSSAFAEQLNLVIDFFDASAKSDRKIGKLILSGGGVCMNGFVAELQTMVDYPVEVIDISTVWSQPTPDDMTWEAFSAQYALALGLLIDGGKL